MFQLPDDVSGYIRGVFSGVNEFVTAQLTRVPGTYETALDTAFITYIAQHCRPIRFPVDWTVKLDTHFIGSGRHWGQWEIADIGLILLFRQGGRLLRTKVALLQSKRLYADTHPASPQTEDEYTGFGRLRESDESFLMSVQPRKLYFRPESKYKALSTDGGQFSAIDDYETLSQIPVYYSFYNPMQVPLAVEHPAEGLEELGDLSAGCRIMPAHIFREVVVPCLSGLTPSYADVCAVDHPPFGVRPAVGGWKLEDFIVDWFINCRAGYRVDTKQDATLANLFGGRSAPISAAVSINIDVPPGAVPVEED